MGEGTQGDRMVVLLRMESLSPGEAPRKMLGLVLPGGSSPEPGLPRQRPGSVNVLAPGLD